MDVRDLKYDDNTFDFIVDKSTIDALLCGDSSYLNVATMLKEVQRVLKDEAIYMIISYGKPENRIVHLERPHLDFEIAVYTIKKDEDKTDISKTHYVYICKKRKDANLVAEKNFDYVRYELEQQELMDKELEDAEEDEYEDKEDDDELYNYKEEDLDMYNNSQDYDKYNDNDNDNQEFKNDNIDSIGSIGHDELDEIFTPKDNSNNNFSSLNNLNKNQLKDKLSNLEKFNSMIKDDYEDDPIVNMSKTETKLKRNNLLPSLANKTQGKLAKSSTIKN